MTPLISCSQLELQPICKGSLHRRSWDLTHRSGPLWPTDRHMAAGQAKHLMLALGLGLVLTLREHGQRLQLGAPVRGII